MQQPFISKVHIKNYRNFNNVEFNLKSKSVIIGENGVGKSNLLKALQLILDPSFSEEDRHLDETDFFDGLEKPMENAEEIIISIFVDGYNQAKNLLCQLTDAIVAIDGKKLLKITYKFYLDKSPNGKSKYRYIIFKGNDENNFFTYEDRKYINLKVIKAIRDVENEMRNGKTSPLSKLLKSRYNIKKEDLEKISETLKVSGADVLNMPEIEDLQVEINKLFNEIISFSGEFNVALKTIDIDASKLLYALKPLINSRGSLDTSLGINNIFYVSLMLLLTQDNIIKTFLSIEEYEEMAEEDDGNILKECYKKEKGNYYLKKNITGRKRKELYNYIYEHNNQPNGTTILAIEEPEAHLHPIYQRLLYKYSVLESNASVLLTTHSTHLSSVASLDSIVHLLSNNNGTCIHTTVDIHLNEEEIEDLERYIDVKRGEIYLARGIIFVEGVTEEYLVPVFSKILDKDLDKQGIVICNVNSTNFKPYKIFADKLGIPNVLLTDGDYYYIESGTTERIYGEMEAEEHHQKGCHGLERMEELCKELFGEKLANKLKRLDSDKKVKKFNEFGIFVGNHTLETDIFQTLKGTEDEDIIVRIFNKLTAGGNTQKKNFKRNYTQGKFDKCLNQITSSHSNIGKGRFAQRLAANCTKNMIPDYINNAIVFVN